jgi:hypothetical protein
MMKRLIGLAAAAAVCLGMQGGTAVAAASEGPEWSRAELPGLAGSLFLLGVSCPTGSLCVATGTQNLIASSTDPTGGAGAWKVVYAGEGPYESPYGGPVITNRQVQGISCPTVRLCVAVTNLGQIYSTTNPTGPASAWKVTEVPSEGGNTHLYGVSCPSASLCVAVSGRRVNRGKVVTSTDPDGGPGAWQLTDLGERFDLRAVSCSSPDLCIAVGANGEVLGSRNPAGGASAWLELGSPGGGSVLQGLSCLPGICLTGNTGGNLVLSPTPLEASSWRQFNGGGSVQITGASCASASACLATDNNGYIHTSTDPLAGSSAWIDTKLAAYSPEAEEFNPENGNGLFGASCPSPSLCAVVGSGGQIFTSTNPFAPQPREQARSEGSKVQRGPKRPKTTIARLRLPRLQAVEAHRGRAMVRFYADGPVRRFVCKVSGRRFQRCRSPWRIRIADTGTFALRVRAVGRTGMRGPVAVKRFWIGKRCEGQRCLVGSGELPPR